MKKILAAALLLLAIGAVPVMSSADDCNELEGNRVCTTDGGGVAVDGAEGNADPLDGFITIEGTGGCASDEGSYDDPEQDRTCLSL